MSAPVRKQVNLPPEVAEQVDEYRFAHRFKSESEAIRRLIELGLEQAKETGKK
jgi:Arc/MetJ-type ribon-helix-helix transcriptional regulator